MAATGTVKVSYQDSSEEEENVSDTTAEDEKSDVEVPDGSEDGAEENEGEDDQETKEKTGLADVMAKILNKQTPKNRPVVLAKALTDRQMVVKRKEKEAAAIEEGEPPAKAKKTKAGDSSDDEYDPKLSKEQHLKRKAWEELGRAKVDVTLREKEKRLQKISTKGVVHLFNTVRKQQKEVEERLKEVGTTGKREKVMKSMSKGAFLDMLKTTPNLTREPVEIKTEIKEEVDSDSDDDNKEKPSWSILRDDFMMGAKMKDWDKDDGDDEASSDEMEESEDDES